MACAAQSVWASAQGPNLGPGWCPHPASLLWSGGSWPLAVLVSGGGLLPWFLGVYPWGSPGTPPMLEQCVPLLGSMAGGDPRDETKLFSSWKSKNKTFLSVLSPLCLVLSPLRTPPPQGFPRGPPQVALGRCPRKKQKNLQLEGKGQMTVTRFGPLGKLVSAGHNFL